MPTDCDWKAFKLDCNGRCGDCDQKLNDCRSKVTDLEKACATEVDKMTAACAQKTLRQGAIWGVVGAGAALAGFFTFGLGTVAIVGGMAVAGGVGFLGGAASKADDCADDIAAKEKECADKVKQAHDECDRHWWDCQKCRTCCITWNALMDRLGPDCDKAFSDAYTALKNAGCDDLWKDFQDIWAKCCKK